MKEMKSNLSIGCSGPFPFSQIGNRPFIFVHFVVFLEMKWKFVFATPKFYAGRRIKTTDLMFRHFVYVVSDQIF